MHKNIANKRRKHNSNMLPFEDNAQQQQQQQEGVPRLIPYDVSPPNSPTNNIDQPKTEDDTSNKKEEVIHPQAWLREKYGNNNKRGNKYHKMPSYGRRGAYHNRQDRRSNNKFDENGGKNEVDYNLGSQNCDGNNNERNYTQLLKIYDKNYKNPIFHMLYKKPLETKEDIEAYIEERKKNYPTRRRVQEREAEIQERRRRGEIIVTASEKVAPLLQMMGIDECINHSQSSSSFRGRERGNRGEFRMKRVTSQHKPMRNTQQQPQGIHKPLHQQETFTAMKGPSLLQKLLKNEIRREQSILLQCFRYIIDKKFFCEEKELTPEILQKLQLIQLKTNDEMTQWEEKNKHSTLNEGIPIHENVKNDYVHGNKYTEDENMSDSDSQRETSNSDSESTMSDTDSESENVSLSEQEEEEIESYIAQIQNLSSEALKEMGLLEDDHS